MGIKNQLKILLFERNENVGQLLCEFLLVCDYCADIFSSSESAYQAFTETRHPICIIGIENESLEEDFAFVKRIKQINPDVILIFLASDPSMDTIAEAYALEADDIIGKPFILEELRARVEAIIRRTHGLDFNMSTFFYRIGKYSFDTKKQLLSIGDTSKKVTTKECELLRFLCENMNNLVSREDILRTVWKNDSYYNARSMDVYITKLRRLLKNDERVGVVNVHGKGYKLLVI
ncbi:MAG: response regulator transcription factor [Tannerellaceae bacterium]|jgi:DNA-binding response OmpR family regulator|nr:response regulator transcription factor [Tannerellaceae bacterium]